MPKKYFGRAPPSPWPRGWAEPAPLLPGGGSVPLASSWDSWKPCVLTARKQAALGHCVNLPVSHWMLLRGPKTGKGGAFLSRISLHSCLAERQPFLSLHGSSLPVILLQQPRAWGKHLQGCLLLLGYTTNSSSNRSALLPLPKSDEFRRGWHLVPRPVFIHNTSCSMPSAGRDAQEGRVPLALVSSLNYCVFLM